MPRSRDEARLFGAETWDEDLSAEVQGEEFDGEMWDDGSYPSDPDLTRPFATYVVLVWERDASVAFRYAVTLFNDRGRKEVACHRAFGLFRRGERPRGVELRPMRGRSVFDGRLIGKVEQVIPWGFYYGSEKGEVMSSVHGIVENSLQDILRGLAADLEEDEGA